MNAVAPSFSSLCLDYTSNKQHYKLHLHQKWWQWTFGEVWWLGKIWLQNLLSWSIMLIFPQFMHCIVDNYIIYHCGNLEDEMTLFYLVAQHALQQIICEWVRKITNSRLPGISTFKSSTKGIYFVSRVIRLFAGEIWIEKVGLGILFNLYRSGGAHPFLRF